MERPSRVGEHNVNLMVEALAHSREREVAEYSVPSCRRHTVDIGLSHLVQHVVDDGCPVRDVICIAQPACLALDYGLERPAGVGGEDGNAGAHGFDGNDAEVFVDGGVEEEAGLGEEGVAEGRVDGGEEEDVYVVWRG